MSNIHIHNYHTNNTTYEIDDDNFLKIIDNLEKDSIFTELITMIHNIYTIKTFLHKSLFWFLSAAGVTL